MSDKPQQPTPKPSRGKKGHTPPRIEGLFSDLNTEPVALPDEERKIRPTLPAAPEKPPAAPESAPLLAAPAPRPIQPPQPPSQPARPPQPASGLEATLPRRFQGSLSQEAGTGEQSFQATQTLTPLVWDSLQSGRPIVSNSGPGQPAALAYARPMEHTGGPAAGASTAPLEAQTTSALLLEVLDENPERVWSEDELTLVEQVTDQLTLALENARLFEESRTRSEQLAILNEMSRNLSAQLNVDQVIETVYQYTSRLLDTANFYVGLYDEDCQEVTFPLAVEEHRRVSWRSRPLGNGLTEYIIATHQPILIKENVSQTIREVLGIEVYGRVALCWLGVPLLYANEVVGVMAVQSYTQDHLYDESHLELLKAIASQAAVALQNARLYAEERRRRQIADTLSEIARAVSTALDLEQIGSQTLEQLGSLIGYTHASLRLVEKGRQRVIAHRDALNPAQPADAANDQLVELHQRADQIGAAASANEHELHALPLPEALLDTLLRERLDVFISNSNTDTRAEGLAKAGILSWIAAPLLAGDQVVGFIEAGSSQPMALTLTHLDLLRTVAAQIAVAIQNTRLFVETQAARDALQVNVRYQESLAKAVASLTERGIAALPEVLETLGEAAQTSRTYYFETQDEGQEQYWRLAAEWRAPGVSTQLNNPTLHQMPVPSLGSWIDSMCSQGFIAAIASELAPEDRPLFEIMEARSALMFMVIGRNLSPGCIGFAQNDYDREWTSEEIAALQTAASAISSTIAREDLFSQVQANLAETEAQYQASARLNSSGNYDEILNVLRQFTLLGHVNAANLTINLFDHPWSAAEPAEWLIPIAHWAARPADQTVEERYRVSDWLGAEKLFDPDRPTPVADVAADPRLDPATRQYFREQKSAHSLLFVPLNVAGRWIGHITALYRRATGFPDQELRRLASLAGQAAVAVESLRLLDETRQRNEELATINQITGAVNRTLELDQILGEILTRVLTAVDFDTGLISIADPMTHQLTLAVQQNLPENLEFNLSQRGFGGTLCQMVFEVGQLLYVPDLTAVSPEMRQRLAAYENQDAAYQSMASLGFSAYLGVPLLSKGTRLGTVCIFSREARGVQAPLSASRLSIMEAVGQQLGVVVENARLFQSTQVALSETDMLYRASAELNAVQSYDEILNTLRKYSILREVDHSLSLDLFERPWVTSGAGSSEAPEKADQLARWVTPALLDPESSGREVNQYNLREFPPARSLLQFDHLTAVHDLAADERLDAATRAFYQAQSGPAPFRVRGLILVPLVVGGLWIGFIHAVYLRPSDWQEADLRRLEVLAGQAAVAAQSLRQFQQIQKRAQYEYLTREIGSQASASIDRDTILRTTARSICQALKGSHVVVRLNTRPGAGTGGASPDGWSASMWAAQSWNLQVGYVYEQESDRHLGLEEAEAQPLLGLCAQSGLQQRPGARRGTGMLPEVHRHGGSTSHLFAPITLRGDMIGTLDVFDLNGVTGWGENDLALIQTISSQMALSLDNARLFQETQSALSETETLFQASAALNAVHSYDDVLETLRKYTLLGQADKLLNILLFNRPWNTDSGLRRGPDLPPSRLSGRGTGMLSADIPEAIQPIAAWSTLPEERLHRRYSPRNYPAAHLLSPNEPALIEDLNHDPRIDPEARQFFLETLEAQSAIFIPLNVGGSWIGFIQAAYSQPTTFDEQELRRLTALASQAAVAVQNLNSVELAEQRAREASQRSQELALINRVVTNVSASLDLQQSLDVVTEELAGVLNAFIGVALLNPSRQILTVVTSASPYPDTPNTLGLEIPLEGNRSSQQVIETRRSLMVEDPQHAEITAPLHEIMRQLDVRSLLIIPLVAGAEVIGTVAVETLHETRPFSADQLRLAETIVFQAAAAIQNARLFEQTQQVLAETEALYQAGARFQVAKTYTDIIDALREYTALGRQAQAIYLDLYDHAWQEQDIPEGSTLIAQWLAHTPAGRAGETADSPRRLLPATPVIQQMLGSDSILTLNPGEEPSGGSELAVLYPALPQARTAAIAPLRAGGQRIGHVCALYSEAVSLKDEDKRRLIALAGQAAVAIQNRRLLEESQRRARQLQTAAEIARDTSGTLALSDLLLRTVNLLCERFGYYHASIFLLDESGTEAVVRESTGPAGEEMKRSGHRLAVGGISVIGQVTATGKSLVVNDVGAATESGRAIHRPNPLLPFTRGELGIPLKTGDRVIGALDVQSTQPNAFSEDDVAVLQILSDQIAVAVDNARAYEISQKAVEEIREADRLKTQFLANMSHELRTPLNSIIGFSRVILKGIDGPVTDQQTQDLSAIYNSGQHLLGLINDVLDLSKIEAGKMELSFEDNVNLGDIVKSVMSTTIGLVKDKPIQLKSNIDPNLPLLSLDPMKIRQVLINLLSNASKFTEQGSITVEAEMMPAPAGTHSDEVIVRVIDSGPGIAPADQMKLFQPFSQVDGSLTRKTGGSGLGLSICHHLIRMHGGRIGLESEVGHGTTFYFTLPLKRPEVLPAETESGPEMPDLQRKDEKAPAAAAPAPALVKPPEPPAAAKEPDPTPQAGPPAPQTAQPTPEPKPQPTGKAPSQPSADLPEGGLILAIDRDQQVIDLYRRYLTSHNYTIISLTELDQATTVARGIQPTIITLDVNMRVAPQGPDKKDYLSDLDGWKVLETLKTDPVTKSIPIVICTLSPDSERALRLGADEYLLKPILEEDLVQALAQARQKYAA